MVYKKYLNEIVVGGIFLSLIITTIIYGNALVISNPSIRLWNWNNLMLILPLIPLLFLQEKASLPSINTINKKKNGWMSALGVGMIFGVLDLVVVKIIMHPEPYTQMPPFLQPFPYSIFLYSSGALDVELYYRMIPITILLLINQFYFKGKYRNGLIVALAIITSLIEPIQQFPSGALWFVIYATISGIAMNAWQFKSYIQYGFIASLAVRLGHYLVWHILLGVFVELVEL
ncbi:hypothetical protein [Sediminibacterium sp.]|uniref:hypothetical protein n=1 Tax=Sediminibacterium sp. TaxID=1917865 RepID=UPI0027270895|nr:hypothetical protein [Sediminibacterium sp.]MDO9157144.1 hypothetical protein [Sediminibacterium sp.]MDP1972980.1 hypothetical protein [Sediminibacterium sp.]MDP2420104.1 hypothetical protein [Sediminibacterium sp.]